MKITEGIHRLGPGLVNVYLVEDAGAITIVDAGMPGDWSDLLNELAAMGRSLDDVRALVLTHGHSDHIGFAERARRERGWTPRIHELDAALARGEVPNPAKGGGPIKPLPLLRFILLGLRRGGLRPPKIQEVATYGDGATLDVPGSPRVIHLPGHTPGSAALHIATRDALLVGDALSTVSVANGSTGALLKIFGDINGDGNMVYVEYRCDTAAGRLYRNSMPFDAGAKPAITVEQILIDNILPNPDATPCFTYQTQVINGTTYVLDVAITLTVRTQNRDLNTGQFMTETKALLNVSPRNVFNVWQLAGLGVTNRVQPTPLTVTNTLLP